MTPKTRILLGVTGGIAAYKSPDLVRRLTERGAEVQVVMTAGAQRFVTPLSFQAVSGRPTRTDLWDSAAEAAMGHIELARWAQLVLIAPASADFIARLAAGRADDLLSTLCLATESPIALAPAMNRVMWANKATQANIDTLVSRGVRILGPGSGSQEEELTGYRHCDFDIRDPNAVLDLFQRYGKNVAVVIHTAAQPSHDWAARAPLVDFSINANGTLNLLEATRQYCPEACFIFTSTNKVYGDTPNRLPLVEQSARWELLADHPYGRYGIDKSMSIDRTMHSLFGASKVAADVSSRIWALFRHEDCLLPWRLPYRSWPFGSTAPWLSCLFGEMRGY